MICKKFKDNAVLYIYGELSETEKREVESHLKECSACSQDFECTKSVFAAIEETKETEIPEAEWEKSWRIIRSKTEEMKASKKSFFFEYKKAFAAAGMLFLFIGGAVIGRFLLTSRRQPIPASAASPVSVDQALSDHFENLKPVFVDYANYSASQKDETRLTVDRELFRNLLLQNYLLKRAIASMNNPGQEQLLEDIELILRDIANLKKGDDATLSLIKETIDQRDILFKMEVLKKI